MANNKRFLYVGGLAEEVDVNLLKTTFSAFGDLVDVNMPMDFTAQKHKGFAFIEFQWPEDAADAIDNMDYGEILGKTIRVNVAKPQRYRESATSNQINSNVDKVATLPDPNGTGDVQVGSDSDSDDMDSTNDPRDQAEPT